MDINIIIIICIRHIIIIIKRLYGTSSPPAGLKVHGVVPLLERRQVLISLT